MLLRIGQHAGAYPGVRRAGPRNGGGLRLSHVDHFGEFICCRPARPQRQRPTLDSLHLLLLCLQPEDVKSFIDSVLVVPLDQVGKAVAGFTWTFDKVRLDEGNALTAAAAATCCSQCTALGLYAAPRSPQRPGVLTFVVPPPPHTHRATSTTG